MEAIILYIIKQLGYSAVFAGYYWLFLRKASFASWNRTYLILATVLSILLPFIDASFTVAGKPLEQPIVLLSAFTYQYELRDLLVSSAAIVSVKAPLAGLYALVVCGLLLLLIKSMVSVQRLKRQSALLYMHDVKVYVIGRSIAPFSLFKSIFWSSELPIDSPEGQQILTHEMEHIRSNHSVDKLLLQLACTLCWFNPLLWLFKRELSLVHEFLADRASVDSGGVETLSKLILCSLYPQQRAFFSNQFFQSTIKRRLVMITNSKTSHAGFRKLMIIPVTLLLLGIFALTVDCKQQSDKTVNDEEVSQKPTIQGGDSTVVSKAQSTKAVRYEEVFQMPTFQGGGSKEFLLWLSKEVKYPEEAVAKKIEGRVVLQFCIDENGEVDEVTVLQSAHKLLDDEVVRVMKTSPRWEPGTDEDGRKVGVIFTLPFKFQLQ